MQHIPQHTKNMRHSFGLPIWGAVVVLGIVIVICVAVGNVAIPAATVLRIVLAQLGIGDGDVAESTRSIIMTIRLPRVLLVALTGAALSASGAAYQGLFRNPLADPYIVGVASGAGLGAIAMVVLGGMALFGAIAMPLGAFFGAFGVVVLVYGIAAQRSQYSNNDLILAGIAIGTLTSALTTYLMIRAGRQSSQLLAFLLGSFSSVGWSAVWIVATAVLIGLSLLMVVSRDLNVLLFTEEQARFLGINVPMIRWCIIVGATLMTATAVAFHGLIGFVGIIVPHSIRLIFGGDHRKLIPLSALYGAVFLVLADMIARTVTAPQELPLGIVTACCGAPFFLWQLLTSKRSL
jgi:iron complex transport system permease protein